MNNGMVIGLIVAFMGIVGGMAIVHHHEDQDREKEVEILRYNQNDAEIVPQRIQPQRDGYRQGNCNTRDLLNLHCTSSRRSFHLDSQLSQEARAHAEYMARNGQLLQHNRFNSNVSYGQTCETTAFRYWMGRTQSRYNIMSGRNRSVGFGSAYDGNGNIYWCAIYR
jgi:hypothetical protein